MFLNEVHSEFRASARLAALLPKTPYTQLVEGTQKASLRAGRVMAMQRVQSLRNNLLFMAIVHHNAGDPRRFAALMDMNDGVNATLKDIDIASAAVNGMDEASFHEAYTVNTENMADPIPGLQEAAEAQQREALRQAQTYLAYDETGFSAIALRVGQLRAEAQGEREEGIPAHIYPYQNPDLVVAGAQAAEMLYSIAYPITDLPQSFSSF